MIGDGEIEAAVLGTMYTTEDDSVTADIDTVDTYQDLSYAHEGNVLNMENDIDAGTFTVGVAGVYKLDGYSSIAPSAGCTIEIGTFVNGTLDASTLVVQEFQNSQDTDSISAASTIILDAGDVVKAMIKSDTAVTLTISVANLTLIRIGPQ